MVRSAWRDGGMGANGCVPEGLNERSQAIYCLGCGRKMIRPVRVRCDGVTLLAYSNAGERVAQIARSERPERLPGRKTRFSSPLASHPRGVLCSQFLNDALRSQVGH